MDKDKKNTIKVRELNTEELENIKGGFIFKGPIGHKLNGVDIICPSCGYGLELLMRNYGDLNVREALFYCYLCKKHFVYEYTEEGIDKKIL